jgi:hypothetical protein
MTGSFSMSSTKFTLLPAFPSDSRNYNFEDNIATRDNRLFYGKAAFLTLIVISCTTFLWLNQFLWLNEGIESSRHFILTPFSNSLRKNLSNFFFLLDEDILTAVLSCLPFSFDRQVVSLGILASFDGTRDHHLHDFCFNNTLIKCHYIQFDNISHLENIELMTHIIFNWDHQLCHLTIFREAGEDALLVKQILLPDEYKHLNVTHGELGDEVYSLFQTKSISSLFMNQQVTVPSDIGHFLREKKVSRFIDCNKETAMKFKRLAPSSKIQVNTRIAMREMKRLMIEMEADVWLMSGSLLGWYRECQAIEYTTDADFATWAINANPAFEKKLLKLTSRSRENPTPFFRIHDIFGNFRMGYELNFLLPNGFKSDLFFMYEEPGNRLSSSGHVVRKRLYYKYYYSKFILCSTIFLGIKVNIPCDPDEVLRTEYGDWKTPITDDKYDYKNSPRNRGPSILYPPDFRPAARTY